MKELWPKAVGGSIALLVGFMIAAATLSSVSHDYAIWITLIGIGAGVTVILSIVGAIYTIANARTAERQQIALCIDDLRRIGKISSEERTWAQKARDLSPYIEKSVQITGTLEEVGSWRGTCALVKIQTCVPGLAVNIKISDKKNMYDYPLSTYDIGQELTVTGKIEDIGPDGILLVNCEIGSIST